MQPAAAALPLDEPVVGIGRRIEPDLGMGHAKVVAEAGQHARIFRPCDHLSAIAENRETARERVDDLGPILESAAIDEADRIFRVSELSNPRNESGDLETGLHIASNDIGGSERTRIEVAEKIGDERTIVTAPRRGRQSAARRSGDENCFRRAHARA